MVVVADLMHFSRSSAQNKYLLIFQEFFIKWIKCKPIGAATGKAIASAFGELILFRWNVPKYFLSDNGREFRNNFLDKVLKD